MADTVKPVEMQWVKEEPKDEQSEEKSASNPKTVVKGNKNLSPAQMRELMEKYQDADPYAHLEPFIVKTASTEGNRFYILRSVNESQMANFDEAFFEMEAFAKEEEIRRAKILFARSGQCKDPKNMTEDEAAEFEGFKENHLRTQAARIANRAYEKVTNMFGVVYPEDHSKRVYSGNVPVGDVPTLSSAIMALSGWSEVSADIDVYEDYIKEPEGKDPKAGSNDDGFDDDDI